MTGRSTAQRRGRRAAEVAEKSAHFFWGRARHRSMQGEPQKKKHALSLRVLCASATSALFFSIVAYAALSQARQTNLMCAAGRDAE